MRRTLLAAAMLLASARAETGTLQGRVTDPAGSVITGAEISARSRSAVKTARSDDRGAYALGGLATGMYAITIRKDGFVPYQNRAVAISGEASTTLDAALELAPVEESVNVNSAAPAVDLAPENNGGAIVLKGADLDALPDDPDELSDALQALAGPAAGPNGGQIFIDGFTGGRLPPKSSIREIRINANPFSAEFDRLGYGRIEIFTKAGTDNFRGEAQARWNNDNLNTRNPFAPNKPPYERREWGGHLSGPIAAKKASYFVDFEKRDVDENTIVNATVLGPDLAPTPFNEALLTPQHRTTFSPRVDWQITPAHTLSVRYTYTSSDQTDAGIGGFSLPSRGYDTNQHQHTFQLTETAVLGKTVSETRLRFLHERQEKQGDDSLPTLQVADAFTGGGAAVGPSFNDQKRWELQNVTSWSMGKHSLRAGIRLRTTNEDDLARSGFGGSVLFAGSGEAPALDANGNVVPGQSVALDTLERYRRTVLLQRMGLSPAQIRQLGGGATQFQIVGGNPEAKVSQWDVAPFIQDDIRAGTDFIVSAGLRYETQDNLHHDFDLAPRLGFAWSPGPKGAGGQARTVVRGGFGIFYDRFGEDLTLRSIRSGIEQQYLVTDPQVLDTLAFDANGDVARVPSTAQLAAFAQPRIAWQISPDLRTPYTAQSSLSLERQLPKNFTVTATFIASQGRRLLRAQNLSASGVAADRVYEIESTGRLNEQQWIVGVNNRMSPKLSVFFRYFWTHARSDTDGADTFPAIPSDLAQEYGRASVDVRHRIVLGGNVTLPGGVRLSPFVIASTGRPFNITLGRDLNGDGLFTDRPALASDPSKAGVVSTPYGLLDANPTAGAAIIPRNFGDGPGFFAMNLRVSRTFRFGAQPAEAPPPAPPGGPDGGGRWGGGRGGGMGGGRGGRGRGDEGGEGGGARGLTVSVSVQNLMNHVNLGTPVGNLSSPLFGQSLASAGGFGGPGGGSAANRRIELQARLAF